MEKLSIAVFDPPAFYPFRSLVQGGLSKWNEILEIERFVRAIVLHDEMSMILEPSPYNPDSDEEMRRMYPGPRNIIVGMGPVLDHYEGLLSMAKGLKPIPGEEISSDLRNIAAEYSNAPHGNSYYDAHVDFAGKILSVLKNGGSAVCNSSFSRALEVQAEKYPNKLFEILDKDWQEYTASLSEGRIGFKTPPILNVILSDCKSREDIPDNLRRLRQEWASGRKKVWRLLDALRNAQTVKEAVYVQNELDEASKYFSPFSQRIKLSPVRILFDLFEGGFSGAIGSALAGGKPLIGAAAGAGNSLLRNLAQSGKDADKLLFGRGAFDLARRVHKQIMNSSHKDILSEMLTQREKDALGL